MADLSALAAPALITLLLMAAFHGTGVDAACRLWRWLSRVRPGSR